MGFLGLSKKKKKSQKFATDTYPFDEAYTFFTNFSYTLGKVCEKGVMNQEKKGLYYL